MVKKSAVCKMVFEKKLLDAQFHFRVLNKECRERRHDPFKFLFLSTMGLLGSQARTRKKNPIIVFPQIVSALE